MRNFIITYNSQNNMFKGHIHVRANTLSDAQDKFLQWLREQPVYTHLWQLTFVFEELGGSLD